MLKAVKKKPESRFATRSIKEKNVILTRIHNRVVYGAVSLGAPFYEHLPDQVKQHRDDASKNYNWVYLPVNVSGCDTYSECQLFAGLNIMRMLPQFRYKDCTFIDAALILLCMIQNNQVVDKIVLSLWKNGSLPEVFIKETNLVKKRQDAWNHRSKICNILATLSRGNTIPNLVYAWETPVLICFHPSQKYIECTHLLLRNEILGILSLVGHRNYSRSDGAVIINAMGKMMSILPYGVGPYLKRFELINFFSCDEASLEKALGYVKRIKPLARVDDDTVVSFSFVHLAYFEILWNRSAEVTPAECNLFFDENKLDLSFLHDDS